MNQASLDTVIWKNFQEGEDLNIKETHVFCVSIDAYSKKISDYKAILNDDEIAKSERYPHHHSKITYITTRYFARKIVSLFTNAGNPSEILFHKKKNKKPTVDGVEFNISHSGNQLLVAVNATEIGIDIELMNPNFDFTSLLENCFDSIEIDAIHQSTDNLSAFYQLWTRKEALLKATGEGLIDRLPEINVLAHQVLRDGSLYQIQSFLIEPNYMASIAIVGATVAKINYWSV